MSQGRLHGIALRLGLATGSVLVFIVVASLWLRWRPGALGGSRRDAAGLLPPERRFDYANIYRRPAIDPELPCELIPGDGRGDSPVNDLGYIGRRLPPEREPGTFRVLGLGDSVTMYYGAEGLNYLSVMESLFREANTAPRVEVLDFGVGGYDTPAEVRQLKVKGLAYHPDLITLGYVLNDAIDFHFTIQRAYGKPVADNGAGERFNVLDHVWQRLTTVAKSRDDFFADVFGSDTWKQSAAALDELARVAREAHVPVVVVVFPVFVHLHPYALQPVHDAVRVEAERHGFGFLDLAPVYAAAGDGEDFRSEGNLDTIHPTPRGHAIAGRALHDYLVARGYAPAPPRRP